MRKIRPGGLCWLGLTVYVVIVDVLLVSSGRESMSQVFGNALMHPIRRFPVTLIWAFLTIHLFAELLPQPIRSWARRYDPLGRAAALLSPAPVPNNWETVMAQNVVNY